MEKEQLMQIKAGTPSKFTKKLQTRLDEVAELVIDLEEQIELTEDEVPTAPAATAPAPTAPAATAPAPTAPAAASTSYTPESGTEHLIHLSIVRGRRFDENTGKELSAPYKQMFTYGEYLNFKKSASLLGYTIVEELYNPYKK